MNMQLRLALAAIWCASAAWAVDWKALQPQGYVSDFAGVVDAPAKARLEAYCGAVEHSTGVQLALVTIGSLEGEPIEDVANTMARGWGVGQKGKNEGILLLLAIQDHRDRLEVGYGLESILPDGLDGSILREMRPALRQQQYGEAVMAAAETLGNAIATAKDVSLDARLPRSIRPAGYDWSPWIFAVFGAVLLIMIVRRRAGPRGYFGSGPLFIPFGGMTGGSTGASSGGGFGGYDSGDSFGGFGGGDFGGGGASSDW